MTQDAFELFPRANHPHLRLSGQIREGSRVVRPARYPREVVYSDRPVHGRVLSTSLAQLRAIHAKRSPVLGVDPERVVVLAYNRAPAESALRAAGLYPLDWYSDRVVVVAPNDPNLEALQERIEKYRDGVEVAAQSSPKDDSAEPAVGAAEICDPNDSPSAPYQSLLDCIDDLRAYGDAEVLTPRLLEQIAAISDHEVLRIDVQCWCPEDETLARSWHDLVSAAVSTSGGVVLDQSLHHRAGLSLLRVEVSAGVVRELASLDQVRRVDVLPLPLMTYKEAVFLEQDDLPVVTTAAPEAPVVAVIDSGVRSGHPLIGAALIEMVAVGNLEAEIDESGHGTLVASLALYGELERGVADKAPLRPAARLVSVRVLDKDDAFSDVALWENQLLEALSLAVAAGARIINLSVADSRRPYKAPRPTPLGAELDQFAREHNVVLVVSGGNYSLSQYADLAHPDEYVYRLLQDPSAGVLDPAGSALALTVGAVGADRHQGHSLPRESVDILPLGGAGLPSPFTRVGPGPAGMTKPELVAPGGHAAISSLGGTPRVMASTGVMGAEGVRPSRLLRVDGGSSFAAPIVTNIAAKVLQQDPTLTANAVRALVLASVERLPSVFDPGDSAADREEFRRLVGYGRPDAERAAFSSDHRAVLLAEGVMPVNSVHLYTVSIPSSFRDSGGWRRESFSLAFDPPTRSTRLDYLGNRMHVFVYVGLTLGEVAQAFIADADAPGESGHAQSSMPSEEVEGAVGPAILRSKLLKFEPSDACRSRGAHQWGEAVRRHRRTVEQGEEYVIAVQNVNRWSAEGSDQAYALAFALERDVDHRGIYQEVRASVQARVDVPLLIQASSRLRV